MVSSFSVLSSLSIEMPKISLQPRFDPTPEPGNSKGLDLVLDAHTDQVTSSVTKPFQVNWKCVVYLYWLKSGLYVWVTSLPVER